MSSGSPGPAPTSVRRGCFRRECILRDLTFEVFEGIHFLEKLVCILQILNSKQLCRFVFVDTQDKIPEVIIASNQSCLDKMLLEIIHRLYLCTRLLINSKQHRLCSIDKRTVAMVDRVSIHLFVQRLFCPGEFLFAV